MGEGELLKFHKPELIISMAIDVIYSAAHV